MTNQAGSATWELAKAFLAQIPGVSLPVDALDRMEGLRQAQQVQDQLRELQTAIDNLSGARPLGHHVTRLLERVTTAGTGAAWVSPSDQLDLRTAHNVLAVIELLNVGSATGRSRDPLLRPEELAQRMVVESPEWDTRLTEVAVVVEDLARLGLVLRDADGNSIVGFARVSPSESFFVATDRFFQPWDPADDSVTVARAIVTANSGSLARLASNLSWKARRLNPAVQVLLDEAAVHDLGSTYSEPFLRAMVMPTPATTLHARRPQRDTPAPRCLAPQPSQDA